MSDKPALFFGVYLVYKYIHKTKIKAYQDFENLWYPMDVPDEPGIRRHSTVGSGEWRSILKVLNWLR